MTFSYYIYYRIEPARATAAEQCVRALLFAVQQETGIAGRLLKKRGEPNLWMEIYENVADEGRFEWELAEATNRLNAMELLQSGSRHLECFEDYVTCA